MLAAARSKARFSVFPPKSIRVCVCVGGVSSGAPWPAIWTEIQGLRLSPGPPPRLPPTRSSRGPGTKLIGPPPAAPPPLHHPPAFCPSFVHLPSNLAGCDSNVRPPGKGSCRPATGAAATAVPPPHAPPFTPPRCYGPGRALPCRHFPTCELKERKQFPLKWRGRENNNGGRNTQRCTPGIVGKKLLLLDMMS